MSYLKKGCGKKGQVTLFIIIGIVVLAVFAFGLFYINQAKGPVEQEPEEIPAEFVPIRNYVEDCLDDLGEQAFREVGEHGGYINPEKYFSKGLTPTESDMLEFSPDSGLLLPYWWHLASDNDCRGDCSFSSNRPPINTPEEGGSSSPLNTVSVESMVSEYIERNLDMCINNFQGLERFDIKQDGDIEVETTVAEKDVIVDLVYPLDIVSSNSEGKIERYRSRLDLNFNKIYGLATDIAVAEADINFLDYHTITLIDLFSGIDNEKLPPLEGAVFEQKAPVYWFESEVKEDMEEMLVSYVPAMQVLGTKGYNYNVGEGEDIELMAQATLNSMTLSLLDPIYGNYSNLDVDFTYLNSWPSYLHITPSEGGLIGPETYNLPSFLEMISTLLGIQRYQFVYDVSYPVVVEIKDDDAFKGEGYNFMFSLESNIRNNLPINTSEGTLQFTGGERGVSMACDINKRNSGNVTIFVEDASTDEPVENAIVYFALGGEECLIDSTDENGTVVAKFPIGIGALKVRKSDYFSYAVPYGTSLDKEDSVDVEIEPYRYRNVSVKGKAMIKEGRDDWVYGGEVVELGENEEALLLLERIKENNYEEDYSVPISLKSTSQTEVRLVPGRYALAGQVMLDEQIVVSPQKRKVSDGFLGIGKEYEWIPEETLYLDQSVSGGVEFNDEAPNKFWHLTSGNLDNSDSLTFYVLSFNLKTLGENIEIEDLSQAGNVPSWSAENRNELEPSYG